MRTAVLGDVFERITNGKNVRQNETDGGVRITRIETISTGTINPSRVGYAGLQRSGNEKWILQAGDILMSHINSPEHVGKCALYTADLPEMIHGMNLLRLEPDRSALDSSYAVHYFRARNFRAQLRRFINQAVNQASISVTNLKSIEMVLPSLDEQRRIADILDKVDALRAMRREALAHLEALSQSIFHEMFGAEDYPRRRLDDIADVASGITKGRKVPAGAELTEIPYMSVSNVQDMSLKMNAVKSIAVTEAELVRFSLQKDDLLMTEGGDPDKLGRGTLWTGELDPCLHQNHIYRVRLKPEAQVLPVYLNWATATGSAKDYFLRCAKQTTGIASINKTQLSATPIPVPPKEVQQEFLRRVSAIEHLKNIQRTQLAELDNLFLSLQDRAFQGKV